MKTKLNVALSTLSIILLVSPLAAQQSAPPARRIDQLENTIAQMQAELQQLRADRNAGPQTLQRPNADRPVQDFRSGELLPAPRNGIADQAPSLGPAPSFAPGQVPNETIIAPQVLLPPPTTTTIDQPVQVIPERRQVMVQLVPVYRVPAYRPPYSGCSSDYGCPYSTRGYRLPYSGYDY